MMKSKESVTEKNSESDIFIDGNSDDVTAKGDNLAVMFLGFIFVSVVIILTLFSNSLIQVFEVVPTNLLLIKSTIQLILFTISNKSNSIKISLDDKRVVAAMVVQGLMSGIAFICNVWAVRLLPLGHYFSITFAKTVFFLILISGITGHTLVTKKKVFLIVTCVLGLGLLLNTQVHTSQTDTVSPLDPGTSIWTGLGLAFLTIFLSSQAEMTVLLTQLPAGVVSFWSAVGGLVTSVPISLCSSEPSILSGSLPSYMEGFLLVFLSLSIITMALFTDQAEKLVCKTFVKIIRSLEIPLAILISLSLANHYLPSYVGCIGIIMIVISSVLAQHMVENEELAHEDKQEYEIV